MAKRILFCADGTWDGAANNTNVYKIFKAMSINSQQVPMHDDGVGADGNPIEKLVGGAFGSGLFDKIKAGYTRISHLYQKDDEIFLFGFSRGAYTARSLGGMIAVCGLPTQNPEDEMVELAFQAYRDKTRRPQLLQQLNQKYAMHDAQISMIGVWDTVGSLGIPAIFGGVSPLVYGFLDTGLHPDVKHAYHAVSIDERRSEFPATLWTGASAPEQVVEQVYFTGVHCDIGGRYPETGLSDITLSWMMSKAAALGVQFDAGVMQQYTNLDPKHALDVKHESWNMAWLFPKNRVIADDASISNSVHIRVQHDITYKPVNLRQSAGVLDPGYKVVSVLAMPEATSAAAAGS